MIRFKETIKEKYDSFINEMEVGKSLSEREHAIIKLVLAINSKSNEKAKNAVIDAKRAGISTEEISEIAAYVIAYNAEEIVGMYEEDTVVKTQTTCCG